MGWRATGIMDGTSSQFQCLDCSGIVWTRHGSTPVRPCEWCSGADVLAAASRAERDRRRDAWAVWYGIGAAAEATRAAESYVRTGAIAAAGSITGRSNAWEWLVAVADDLAICAHTRGWRPKGGA